MKKTSLFCIIFIFFMSISCSTFALTTDEALKELMGQRLYWDFGGYYPQKTQPWPIIETYEDVATIPFKLEFKGNLVPYSTFKNIISRYHLTETDKDNLINLYGKDETYFVVKPDEAYFFMASCGIHSGPPPCPPGEDEAVHNAKHNWPCTGCGRDENGNKNTGHSEAAYCQHAYMGIENPSAQYKIKKHAPTHAMEVFSVHIPTSAEWYHFKGSKWREAVTDKMQYYSCHCTSCVCWGNSYYDSNDCYHCCTNEGARFYGYKIVNFDPTTILTRGTNFHAFTHIKDENYQDKANTMRWRDRTPPVVWDASTKQQSTTNSFPTANALLEDETTIVRATTGDFRKLSLMVNDNHTWEPVLTTHIAIKHKTWATNTATLSNSEFYFVNFYNGTASSSAAFPSTIEPFKLPTYIYGELEYTAFVVDGRGILNPGHHNVIQNTPTNCYNFNGFTFNGKTGANLLEDPATAKPFPFTREDLPALDKYLTSSHKPKSTGHILIHDNDRPNIMLAISNLRQKVAGDTNYKIIFPPPLATAPADFWKPNEYDDFIKGCELTYDKHVATLTPYFMPIADSSAFGDAATESLTSTAISKEDATALKTTLTTSASAANSFFRKLSCIEDYQASDTIASTGVLISDSSDVASLSARLSFGESIGVFLVEPLEEDVEYEISLLAQDNVRYAANASGLFTPTIPAAATNSAGTGIASITIKCFVFDSGTLKEEFNQTIDFTKTWQKSVHGPFTVVFRDPIKIAEGTNLPGTITIPSNAPFVVLTAEDLAGNTRQITMFLQVEDRKARIRTLEQRHIK